MKQYSVKKLATLAGVSVRTLHHYDRLGLLKPSIRTEARYRLYGERELLRLQQILFYKELDFSLEAILAILDNPNFDQVKALEQHKQLLETRQHRLSTLLATVDKTILTLKGERTMLTDDELYEGFPKGKTYRQEAIDTYGAQVIEESETKLRQMSKPDFNQLKADQLEIGRALSELVGYDPASAVVQQQIARHYANIRGFWGESVCKNKDMADAYKGLAQLYVDDPRYTTYNGQQNPTYAAFLAEAMVHFANTKL